MQEIQKRAFDITDDQRILKLSRDIFVRVREEIPRGRIAYEDNNVETLLQIVAYASPGPHLEIGTLFGGSAIAVALMKQALGEGRFSIHCVDPMDGYYRKHFNKPEGDDCDQMSHDRVSPSAFWENCEYFGVHKWMVLYPELSDPFVETLLDSLEISFATAFIDGDHWGDGPLRDWEMVRDSVTDIVIFDNCDNKHPDVQRAYGTACEHPEWETGPGAGIIRSVKRTHRRLLA